MVLCYSSPRKLMHIALENLEVGRVLKMLKGDIKKTHLPEAAAQPPAGMPELDSNASEEIGRTSGLGYQAGKQMGTQEEDQGSCQRRLEIQ